jgi:hypothetical protein
MADDSSGLGDDVVEQLKMQGVASYKVKDGEVFVFSREMLTHLLAKAQESGKVVLFVKTREIT